MQPEYQHLCAIYNQKGMEHKVGKPKFTMRAFYLLQYAKRLVMG